MTTNADDVLFAKSEGIEWMATNEISEFRIAESEKVIGALHAAAYWRRDNLCELDGIALRCRIDDQGKIRGIRIDPRQTTVRVVVSESIRLVQQRLLRIVVRDKGRQSA